MTDKQIIIDGVDVSGCDIFALPDCCIVYNAYYFQCSNRDCYYKQLKRKEQECEQLSNAYEACKDSRLKAYNTIDMLEQECENMREAVRKDFCSHYVLGECSQGHHNNCVGRNQCIKDLEQECEEWKHQAELGVDTTDRLAKELEEKEQECEKLKEENEKLKEEITALNIAYDDLMEVS